MSRQHKMTQSHMKGLVFRAGRGGKNGIGMIKSLLFLVVVWSIMMMMMLMIPGGILTSRSSSSSSRCGGGGVIFTPVSAAILPAIDPIPCMAVGASDPAPSIAASCPSAGPTTSRAQAHANARLYAPRLHFHVLERYYPGNVDTYLQHATIFNSERKQLSFFPLSREEELGRFIDDPANELYYVTAATSNTTLRAGAPFDSSGLSTAPLYYQLHAGNSTANPSWIYSFYIFYTWNGCSNQQMQMTQNSEQILLEYQACDAGVHEGDWERVTVEVCGRDPSKVLRVAYNQHGWNEILDCAIPNSRCQFVTNTTRPLGFVALGSHATYPQSATAIVYSQLKLTVISTVDAVSLVDRTQMDRTKWWDVLPNGGNLVRLPDYSDSSPPQNYSELVADGAQQANAFSRHVGWHLFRGRWGASYSLKRNVLSDPICLRKLQTVRQQCPNTGILEIVRAVLGLARSQLFNDIFGDMLQQQEAVQEGLVGWGPKFSHLPTNSSRLFDASKPAPMLAGIPAGQKLTVVCPNPLIYIPDAIFTPPEVEESNRGFAMAIGAGVVAVLVIVILIIVAMVGRRQLRKDHGVRHVNRNLGDMDQNVMCRNFRDVAESIPAQSIVGFLISIAGFFILSDSFRSVFSLMELYVEQKHWEEIEDVIDLILPLVAIFDAFALIVAFFVSGRTFEYWCLAKNPILSGFIRGSGWMVQGVVVVLVVTASLVSMVCFGMGSVLLFLRLVFDQGCSATTGLVSGVCIDLSDWGFQAVFCGSDLTQFCNNWAKFDSRSMLIGAGFLNFGQLILMTTAGANWVRFRKRRFKPLPYQVLRGKEFERQASLRGGGSDAYSRSRDIDDEEEEEGGEEPHHRSRSDQGRRAKPAVAAASAAAIELARSGHREPGSASVGSDQVRIHLVREDAKHSSRIELPPDEGEDYRKGSEL